MSENIFIEKDKSPTEEVFKKHLDTSYPILNEIREFIKTNIGEVVEEWKYYGKKTGWLLKMLLKKRNLFFTYPCSGYFKLSFTFGEKAFNAINESDVNEDIKSGLKNARKYAEGRVLILEVKNKDILGDIKKLIELKVKN